MSGILLGKTMGRGSELADRFESDWSAWRAGGAPAHGRALGDGVDPDQLRGDAGRGLLVRRARAGGRDQVLSRFRCSSPSRRSRRGCSSRSGRCSASAWTCRPRLRCSTASSSTSISRSTSWRSLTPSWSPRPATSPSRTSGFPYGDEWTLEDVSFTVPAGTTTALVGETGSGKADTVGYLAARLWPDHRGRITINGTDIRDLSFQALNAISSGRLPGTYLFPRLCPREPALRKAGRDRRGTRAGGGGGPHPRRDRLYRMVTTRSAEASAATASPAARSSGS